MNEWEAIVRTIAALVAGGAIGLERSYPGRAAGLRPYQLVAFGSPLRVPCGPPPAGEERGDAPPARAAGSGGAQPQPVE